MPLKAGSGQKVISQNISEFHTGKTYAATKAKFGKKKADRQAIAVALSTARKYGKGKAFGGPNLWAMMSHQARPPRFPGGMINSRIPGRTDKLPMRVPSGSYVLPADIPSALGQGNTMAGADILGKMFKTGPYGMQLSRIGGGGGPRASHMNLGPNQQLLRMPRFRQAGGGEQTGNEGDVPIIAAGGEYILHPHIVREVGHGSLKAGHKVLDKFVLNVRQHHIKTLKKLPGPKA